MKLSDINPLMERIYVQNGKVEITIQKDQYKSDKEQISTFIRRQPYEAHYPEIKGSTIYSLYAYSSDQNSTDMLSSLKGKGPYKCDPLQVEKFLERSVSGLEPVIDRHKPDIILYPKSSSKLTSEFVEKIHAKYPQAEVLPDAFVKKLLKAEDVEPLINTKHPDWAEFAEKFPDDVEKLKKGLSNMIKKYGGLEIKKIHKKYGKFIHNFMEFRDAYEVLDKVLDKNVLIVDDVLSSGTTLRDMIGQMAEFEPKTVNGVTLFKSTTADKN